jgi:hypothetical protein
MAPTRHRGKLRHGLYHSHLTLATTFDSLPKKIRKSLSERGLGEIAIVTPSGNRRVAIRR